MCSSDLPPPRNAHPATQRSARALSQRDFGHALSSCISSRGARRAAAGVQCAALTINFVRVAEGRVTGTLAPYADPETGVQLFTAFDGLLRGDAIEGTYTTRAGRSIDSQTGEWKVTRRKP